MAGKNNHPGKSLPKGTPRYWTDIPEPIAYLADLLRQHRDRITAVAVDRPGVMRLDSLIYDVATDRIILRLEQT